DAVLRLRVLAGTGGYPLDFAVHGPEQDRVRELAEKLAERLGQSKELTDVFADRASAPRPWLYLDVDRDKAKSMGVWLDEVFKTLQVYTGHLNVNDFNRFGRTWQVIVQAEPGELRRPEEIQKLRVRNARGEIVPLGTLVRVRDVSGPAAIDRL